LKPQEGFGLKPGIPEEEGEGTSAESSDEPVLDPHIWLNPQLYKKQAQVVRNALVKADPESEAAYRDNLASLEKDLDELDSEMERGLSSCQRHTIVTSYAAFAYLADRYGLEQLAVTGLSPDAEPSPARLREIIQQVRDEGATHIFFETLVSPAVSETVAKEVGAQTLVLDPIEGLTPEEITGGADYFSIQRQNLANLRSPWGVHEW
jgi:zinc transport system substrate-binding protein